MEFYLIIGIGLVVLIVSLYLTQCREQERRQVYQNWAAEHRWTYCAERDRELYHRYQFLKPLCRGSNRYAVHVLEGYWCGYPAKAFTFHYQTYSSSSHGQYGSSTTTTHNYLSVVLIHTQKSLPALAIRPAGLLHKIKNFLNLNPLVFQSLAFTEMFVVDAGNKQFAQDFCDQAMMEYFLQRPGLHFEINQNVLVIYQRGRLIVDSIESCLRSLNEIHQQNLRKFY